MHLRYLFICKFFYLCSGFFCKFKKKKNFPCMYDIHCYLLHKEDVTILDMYLFSTVLNYFQYIMVQQILSLPMLSIGQFVLCTYDGHKWVGMSWEVNTAQKDIEIKSMHPPCRRRSYTWPRRDDLCWLPITNSLILLKTPSLTTASVRQYYFHNGNQTYIQDKAL